MISTIPLSDYENKVHTRIKKEMARGKKIRVGGLILAAIGTIALLVVLGAHSKGIWQKETSALSISGTSLLFFGGAGAFIGNNMVNTWDIKNDAFLRYIRDKERRLTDSDQMDKDFKEGASNAKKFSLANSDPARLTAFPRLHDE